MNLSLTLTAMRRLPALGRATVIVEEIAVAVEAVPVVEDAAVVVRVVVAVAVTAAMVARGTREISTQSGAAMKIAAHWF